MTELTHIKTYTSGDTVVISKKHFESIFEVMDKLEEKNQELEEENKQLRKLLKIGRTNAKDIIDVLNEQEQYKEENKQLKQLLRYADDIIHWNTVPQCRRDWERQKERTLNE